MAVTPIGTNTVTAISRRLIVPKVTDNVYLSNPLFFRWNRANKIHEGGGYQIEVPLMYTKMAAGGVYSGYQILNVAPTDSIQNGALPWAQHYVAVAVDGLTQLRAASDQAIVSYLATQFKQAEMEMCDQLGYALWSSGMNALEVAGLYEVVDNGAVQSTYAGISHSSNSWWNAQIDSTTTTMSLTALNAIFGSATSGGRSPTCIVSGRSNYNRYWNLNLASQSFPVQPAGQDQQAAQAGFENLVFNGVPWYVDDHMGTAAANAGPFFLNEVYFDLIVASRADMTLRPFVTPPNQDAMVALLLWAGQLTCGNIARQGAMTALTG